MFAAAIDAFGRVDAVLNVADIGTAAPLAEVMMEDYDRTMDVDLRGVFLGTKHGIKTMLPTGGGVIVNWSSTGGMNTTPFPAERLLGRQGSRRGVRYPGHPGHLPRLHRDRYVRRTRAAERLPQLVRGTALKRDGQPEEVAELAAFLCSDRSPYITGAVIPVHGGMSRRRRRRLPRRLGFSLPAIDARYPEQLTWAPTGSRPKRSYRGKYHRLL